MRTLESDIKAIRGGEASPMPESVLPSELKEVFEQPETVAQLETVEEVAPRGKKFFKIILFVVGILIVGGGLGLLGYYVIYPLLSPPPKPSVVQQPSGQQPSSSAQAPIQVRIVHKSYFVSSPTAKTTINFRDLNRGNIIQALKQVASEQSGTIKEIEIFDSTGGQIYADNFFSNLIALRESDKNILSVALEPDFTAFLYYDSRGVWPGYVMKLKSDSGFLSKLQNDFLPYLENSDLSGFYLASPGVFGAFQNGKVKNYATRYAVGSTPGAAFNYVFAGDYLIFSSSYDGLKLAIAALGL